MHDEAVLITVLLTVFLIFSLEAKLCFESLPTIQNVIKCPINDTELQLAVKRKRCDVLAGIQTCVPDPKQFVYHCLPNQREDGFVEVCAPKWILTGYCGGYDIANGKIFNNVHKDCTLFDKPCPKRFNSSDSYHYQGCFEIKKDKEKTKLRDSKESESPCSSDSPIFWIVPSFIAVGFMMAFIYEFIKLQKLQKLAEKKDRLDIKKNKGEKKDRLDIEKNKGGNSEDDQEITEKKQSFSSGQGKPGEGKENENKEHVLLIGTAVQYRHTKDPHGNAGHAASFEVSRDVFGNNIPTRNLSNSYPGCSGEANNAVKEGDMRESSEEDKPLAKGKTPSPFKEKKKKKQRTRRSKPRKSGPRNEYHCLTKYPKERKNNSTDEIGH